MLEAIRPETDGGTLTERYLLVLQRNLVSGYQKLVDKSSTQYESEFTRSLDQAAHFVLGNAECVTFVEPRVPVMTQAESSGVEIDPAIFTIPDVHPSPPYAARLAVIHLGYLPPREELKEIPSQFRLATAAEAFGLNPKKLFEGHGALTILLAGGLGENPHRVLALDKIGERVRFTHKHVDDGLDFAAVLVAKR